MTPDQIDGLLNKKSGLLGVAGIGSSDMRDVIAAAESGNPQARQALDMFVHRLVFYIGAYYTLLGSADAVVFTGGIGENSSYIRAKVVPRLSGLGCELDAERNNVMGKAAIISTAGSRLKVVVMPTNEELMIARETTRVLTGSN
jgi:acetate kinase